MSGKSRILGLDGARAIAVALVVVAHAAMSVGFPFPGLEGALKGLGGAGVLIFFVLSGYLQTTLLLSDERGAGRICIRAFYIKRVLRIMPTLLVYVGFVCLWAWFGSYPLDPWHVTSVLLCFRHVLDGDPLLAHFWSLSLELVFYLVWPVLLSGMGRERRAGKTLVLALSLACATGIGYLLDGNPQDGYYFWRALALHPILLGAWIALAGRQIGASPVFALLRTWPQICFLICLGVMGVLSMEPLSSQSPFVLALAELVRCLAAVGLIVSAMQAEGACGFVLNSTALRFVATISFGAYVWQQFLFFADPNHVRLSQWAPFAYPLFWFPWNVAVTFFAAYLSYRVVEKPLDGWRRRLAGKALGRRRVAPPARIPEPVSHSR